MGLGKASLFGARRDSNVSSVKNQTKPKPRLAGTLRLGWQGEHVVTKNIQDQIRLPNFAGFHTFRVFCPI